jgi:hypothetical protein
LCCAAWRGAQRTAADAFACAPQYDTSVPASCEADIFAALELEYVEPHRRSV